MTSSFHSLTKLSLFNQLQGLEQGEFTASELVAAYLDNIASNNEPNCYITLAPDQAQQQAKASDQRRRSQQARPLEGIPIAVKDIFCTAGIRTTAASKILSDFIPNYESFVTAKLWESGAILLGKTNMDEFAMGSSSTASHFGPVVNPWRANNDPQPRVAGGSSGGSAAAVASLQAPLATGSDTGGSVRQPAAYCGIVGIKPSYGRCSRFGMIAFASSLDQAGMMARDVDGAALGLGIIMGHDPRDATATQVAPPALNSTTLAKLRQQGCTGMRIGIPQEYFTQQLPPTTRKLLDQTCAWLRERAAEIIEVSLPHTEYALPVYYIIASAEASSNLARYDGVRYGWRAPLASDGTIKDLYEQTRSLGFGPEVQRRILIGTFVLSAGYYDAYYHKAQQVRTLISQDFQQAFRKVDLLLTPTTPSCCFPHADPPGTPVAMYHNDIFTVPASLAGLPAVSLPVGCDAKGLPIGIQLIAPSMAETSLLAAAYSIEESAQFNSTVC